MDNSKQTVSVNEILEAAFTQLQKTPALEEYINWKDWQNRILVINEPIDEAIVVHDYILPILRWNEEDDDLGLSVDERKPITLYLNTPGGDVFIGLILAEVIKKSTTPVHITVLALAASMGGVILMAGHKRSAFEFSNVLIHDGSLGLHGSRNKVKDNMKFYDAKDEQLKKFILTNTKITEEKYKEMDDREWWLTAEEALEQGIIDEII
jgi:ATP-dependent Clp protease protease subunit